MAERGSPDDDLTAILQQIRLQQADNQSPSEITGSQIELLLTRVAALTNALRRAKPANGMSRAASRLLLADLAMVTAQLRANTNALDGRLTRALDDARAALERAADTLESSRNAT